MHLGISIGRGVEIECVHILRSGQGRDITRAFKALMKRHSVIQSAVGHIKMDRRLSRSSLNGPTVTRGAGHNLRGVRLKLNLNQHLSPITSLAGPMFDG